MQRVSEGKPLLEIGFETACQDEIRVVVGVLQVIDAEINAIGDKCDDVLLMHL